MAEGGKQIAPDPAKQRTARIAILLVSGLGLVLWPFSFIPVYQSSASDPFQMIFAFYATLVCFPFLLPAFVLALIGRPRGLRAATVLALIGGSLGALVFVPMLVLTILSPFFGD
jgi:hypothetical protein